MSRESSELRRWNYKEPGPEEVTEQYTQIMEAIREYVYEERNLSFTALSQALGRRRDWFSLASLGHAQINLRNLLLVCWSLTISPVRVFLGAFEDELIEYVASSPGLRKRIKARAQELKQEQKSKHK